MKRRELLVPATATLQEAIEIAYKAGYRAGAMQGLGKLEEAVAKIIRESVITPETRITLLRPRITAEEANSRDITRWSEDLSSKSRKTYRDHNPLSPCCDIAIEDLDLSVRTYNVLKRKGIHAVGNLPPRETLPQYEGFGSKSINDLHQALNRAGVTLHSVDD